MAFEGPENEADYEGVGFATYEEIDANTGNLTIPEVGLYTVTGMMERAFGQYTLSGTTDTKQNILIEFKQTPDKLLYVIKVWLDNELVYTEPTQH